MSQSNNAKVVWYFSDGKPGHVNQTLGLIQALSKKIELQSFEFKPVSFIKALLFWLLKMFPATNTLPSPDLIIGAGHSVHLSMLAARRARGGKAIVLMKPSLPLIWFDLCIIPEHDGVDEKGNVLLTRGALNRIVPSRDKQQDFGIMLIGGPSPHYDWDDASLVERIKAVVEKETGIHWILTTSRRTPASLGERLNKLSYSNIKIVPWQETDADWLPAQLSKAAYVWITEDSVSMIYEAITSGANCGLLDMLRKSDGRLAKGVDKLVTDGFITPFKAWQEKGELVHNNKQLNEAVRCAEWINENIIRV
ncbi:MAG: mitochondrial fission ELM1 family protein [Gammaproteobacteria bacterium]|nr:mitochondrial fission ELM1 family protein [Gammaproteobacteria bacterium]MDH5594060.1 mitochondrial fission ELM1 family protein [Gammaproteobacteria bacterium]MDH5613832.1 mitochondrial fission ELM1 family protein [Gammaproteobacteria bacterium]